MPEKKLTILLCFITFFIKPPASESFELLYSDLAVTYALNAERFTRITDNSVIRLSAAGNETVFFQVTVKSGREGGNISVRKKDDLLTRGPFTATIYSVEMCQAGYEADCLVPLSRLEAVNVSSGAAHTFFFEIDVMSGASPGVYNGSLMFMSGKALLATVNYRLKVHGFSLPERPSLKVDLNNYGTGFVKEEGYEYGSEEALRLVHSYYRFIEKQGMLFNPLPYRSQRGTPHPSMAPVLEGAGSSIRVKDWSGFDRFYGPVFDGTLFASGVPVDHQYLPFNPEWPSDFSGFFNNRELYESEWRRVAAEFITHFKKKGWKKTVFQIYLNQTPRPNNRVPWNLDEPKGKADYKALRYYADLTHRIFPAPGPFRFRMDISHFYCDKHRGNIKKDFRVNGGNRILEPVDIWVISKHSFDGRAGQRMARELVRRGKEVYEYMSGTRMPLIGEPLQKAVRYGWNSWIRGEAGILFWNTVKRRNVTSDGRNFLVYSRSEQRKLRGPFASVRLKAVQRGVQDFEYFRIASRYRNISDKVKDAVNGSPEKYRETRREIAGIITSMQGG